MKRLYARIYLHFVLILIVVGIATSVLFTTGFRNAVARGWVDRLARHAAWLVGERWSDGPGRERMVRRLSDELDLDLTVRDPAGRVVATTGSELPTLPATEAREVQSGPVYAGRGRGWYVAAPIRDRQSGALLGVIAGAPARRWQPPSLLRPLLIALLALFVVGAGTLPLARRISRPVERLTVAVRRFGGGDLAYRVPTAKRRHHHHQRTDELAELTRAWNEMAERIEGLVRGQRELLANVSHELRSPLARVRVALELLPEDGAGEGRKRDITTDIDELDRLIGDLLELSRLDASGLVRHAEPVALLPLVEALVARAAHDPLVAPREVRSSIAAPISLTVDGALLKRALWNLVENAAKYGAAPITLGAERRGASVVITVSDEGQGIPPADRQQVFQPFYRSGAAARSARGYGVGLAFARRVAEVHGGTIRAEAVHADAAGERGCRMVIELPAESV